MRISYLDGIRGILACEVALSHISGWGCSWVFPWPFANANFAVDCFFIMSGFVLTYANGKDIASGKIGYGRYLALRGARLLPLHWLALFAYLAISVLNSRMGHWFRPDVFNAATVAENAALVQNVGFDTNLSVNDPSWSISVELWISGLMLVLFLRHRVVWSIAAVAAAYAMLAYFNGREITTVGWHNLLPGVNSGLVRGAAGIILGSVLFRSFTPSGSQKGLAADIAAGLLAGWVFFYISRAGEGLGFISAAGFCALIVLIWTGRAAVTASILGSSPLVFLGKISYALYLIHMPVLLLLDPHSLRGEVMAFVVSFSAAALLHFYVEKPVYGLLKNHLSSKRSARDPIALTLPSVP